MIHEPLLIAEWSKNSREVLRVRISSYEGRPTIEVRNWYHGKDGELRAGKGGLTIAVRHLPMLAASLNKALDEARNLGLIEK